MSDLQTLLYLQLEKAKSFIELNEFNTQTHTRTHTHMPQGGWRETEMRVIKTTQPYIKHQYSEGPLYINPFMATQLTSGGCGPLQSPVGNLAMSVESQPYDALPLS